MPKKISEPVTVKREAFLKSFRPATPEEIALHKDYQV